MNRFFRWLILFLFMAVVSGASCSKDDDVAAIRKLVSEGVRLGEEHDIGGLIKLTADDYETLPGNLDRRETRRVLWMAFNRYGEFRILHPLPKVTLDSEVRSASAIFPFLMVKKETSLPKLRELYEDPKQWLEEVGERADLYRLKLDLVKAEGDWLVRRARLEKFRGLLFSD